MKQHVNTLGALALAALAAGAAVPAAPAQEQEVIVIPTVIEVEETPAARAIDLVICLDTSGSMSGLLDSARQKLWAIVNDLALAKPSPRLRVALLTYGNDGHAAEEGWVFVQTPFTEDLDLVSQRLFEQTTNGGTELVGRVMKKALDTLRFDPSPETLKLLFVAGNESADQDQEFSFRDLCKRAIEQGIMVNSIYCGNPADDIAPGWREVAKLADGHFASIDQDHGTVVVETPFDEELAALSAGINDTYVPYGEAGLAGCSNQWAQDRNAATLNRAAVATRAQTKGGGLYKVGWDLCNLVDDQSVDLTKVKKEDLPEEMREMTLEQQQAFLDQKRKQRAAFQEKIDEAGKQRQAWVEAELKQRAATGQDGFDLAVRRAIREQATVKGFTFAEPLPEPPADAPETTPPPAGTSAGPAPVPATNQVQVPPTQNGQQVRQAQQGQQQVEQKQKQKQGQQQQNGGGGA